MEKEIEAAISKSRTTLGIKEFKPKQLEPLTSFLSGKDTFVSLPTGYGKSVIFAALPTAFDALTSREGSIVVCISPLVSLMKDQKNKFSPKGLITEYICETQHDMSVKRKVLNGQIPLVYISPESLITNRRYRTMLLSPRYQEHLVALVVDEAHCVKTWGDNFRKAFAEIGKLRSLVPSSVNILATATLDTYDTITQRLSMINPTIISLSPSNDNIFYSVRPKCDIEVFCEEISEQLRTLRTSFLKTVIYVRTYTDCLNVYMTLKKMMKSEITEPPGCPSVVGHWLVDMFNRAVTESKKEEILSNFMKPGGTLRLVIATTAFGMGVDCPDIRRVIHWGLPSSIEEYVQESGRCGRDGASPTGVGRAEGLAGETSCCELHQ